MKRIILLTIGILMFIYPLVVYFGLPYLGHRELAFLMFLLLVIRLAIANGGNRQRLRQGIPLLILLSVGLGFLLCLDPAKLPLLFPFFISAFFLIFFVSSLFRPPTIAERFARLEFPELPPSAIRYCRRVTMIWCVFFVFNGGLSLWLACHGPLSYWTIYNGLISYVLMGAIMGGEFCYRKFVKIPQFHQHLRQHAEERGEDR